MTPRDQRFQKAYNALVRAFFEGTLAKGTCLACACGNIIFDAINKPVTKEELQQEIDWINSDGGGRISDKAVDASILWADKRIMETHYRQWGGMDITFAFRAFPDVKDQINEAGYTIAEFAQIETAFEMNTKIRYSEYPNHYEQDILEDQYRGLCAVVDVLLELENETTGGDELKQKFREHPKLQVA